MFLCHALFTFHCFLFFPYIAYYYCVNLDFAYESFTIIVSRG